jgi:hypothetical protein
VVERLEEALREDQAADDCNQRHDIGRRRLSGAPARQHRGDQVHQDHATEQNRQLRATQPERRAGTAVGVADQAMQREHENRSEQQAEEHRLSLVAGSGDSGLQGDIGSQLMFRDHAHVHVQRAGTDRQRQQAIGTGREGRAWGKRAGGATLPNQVIAVEDIEIQLVQVGGIDA